MSWMTSDVVVEEAPRMLDVDSLGTREKELLEESFSFLPVFGNILNQIFLECFFQKKNLRACLVSISL